MFSLFSFVFAPFFSSFAVVGVDVTVLAHTVSIEFIVRAVPWFFGASIFVVAVVAHSFGVVFAFMVAAVVDFFAD